MRKSLALALLAFAAPAVAMDAPEILTTEVGGTPAEVSARLDAMLPHNVVRGTLRSVETFTYTGDDAPDAFLAFLISRFPDLDGPALAESDEVSLALAIGPGATGVTLQLMVTADTPVRVAAPSVSIPSGAEILMENGNSALCTGQRILIQAAPPEDSARLHLSALQSDGFEMADPPPGEMSFFVGHRPGCAVFLYVEADTEDENRSTVILRYVSE